MNSFYTTTPAGETLHIKGNLRMDDRTLHIITHAFDLATEQATAETELERYTPQQVAYAGLEIISEYLEAGTRHYRSRGGGLLTHLDQVVRAILDNELGGSL